MDTNKSIKSGDFWSTHSTEAIPGMLVFVEVDEETVHGYPMFCEGSQATGECFCLIEHPEFDDLLDERWVNFGKSVTLKSESLYARLGHSDYAMDCLRDFKRGNEISLTNGIPMIPGIGDPREEFQAKLYRNLQKLAGVSSLQLMIEKLQREVSLDALDDALASLLGIDYGGSALFGVRSMSLSTSHMIECDREETALHNYFHTPLCGYKSFGKEEAFTDSLTPKQPKIQGCVLSVENERILIQMKKHGKCAFFTFTGENLRGVEICMKDSAEWKRAREVKPGIYATEPLVLSSCKAQLSFLGGDDVIVDLNLG